MAHTGTSARREFLAGCRDEAPLLLGVAPFGFAHGWAHGAEGPAQGLAIYAAGFAGATMGLHLAGIALGKAARNGALLRGLGGGTVAAGLVLAMVG